MWTDVVDLHEFYRSRLGQVARRLVRERIRLMWPDVRGMSVLGLGYATPYLRPFLDEAERVTSLAPAQQGVMPWPSGEPGLVTLADETELPFADLSVDRLLVIHAAEYSEQLRAMMREAWRVLSGNGRMLIVAPNRRGIWARIESTPIGYGHPYSSGQLKRMLRNCLFTPVQTEHALYLPPTQRRVILHSAPAFERVGDRFFHAISGVVMVEATKQIYAATPAVKATQKRGLIALPGRGEAVNSRDATDGLSNPNYR